MIIKDKIKIFGKYIGKNKNGLIIGGVLFKQDTFTDAFVGYDMYNKLLQACEEGWFEMHQCISTKKLDDVLHSTDPDGAVTHSELKEILDSGDFIGTQGPQGIPGPIGPMGQPGQQGTQGLKGDKGDVGATGATGPKGDKGDVGATGSAGPKGDKGDVGEQGRDVDIYLPSMGGLIESNKVLRYCTSGVVKDGFVDLYITSNGKSDGTPIFKSLEECFPSVVCKYKASTDSDSPYAYIEIISGAMIRIKVKSSVQFKTIIDGTVEGAKNAPDGVIVFTEIIGIKV